jgi:hypothetical protein
MPKTFAAAVMCVIAATALVGAATAAGAQQAIGPNQHFIGLVNGSNDMPTVLVVCPGPVVSNQSGRVAGGQTLSVAEVADGAGYTGPFDHIYAWLVPAPGGKAPKQMTFAKYGHAKRIPKSVRVPCDGTGTVEFSSCPYLAPCAFGWVADDVQVQFVNIAV